MGNDEITLAGIDGCPYGWILVTHQAGKYAVSIHESFAALMQSNSGLDRVLIDIPIGLSTANYPRTIEKAMRRELGPRSSTVFNAPCRLAVYEKDNERARRLNQQVENKSLSIQSLLIRDKIREVDACLSRGEVGTAILLDIFLDTEYADLPARLQCRRQAGRQAGKTQSHTEAEKTPCSLCWPQGALCPKPFCPVAWSAAIIESHPELCFKYLNGGVVLSKKSKPEGIEERLEILSRYEARVMEIYNQAVKRFKRKEAKRDDIIDAICLCVVNKLAGEDRLKFLADENGVSENGVKIRIGYYDPMG
ncbi:MAG: DUF429 domain-containing protein [Phaeodactylibacter sp.]|nr:DUF429 domain-containing protein [Phaeodactylibacter sp.]